MLIRVQVSRANEEKMVEKLNLAHAIIEKTEPQAQIVVMQAKIDPGFFGALSDFVQTLSPAGILEVRDFSVQVDNEADVDSTQVQGNVNSVVNYGEDNGAVGRKKGKKKTKKIVKQKSSEELDTYNVVKSVSLRENEKKNRKKKKKQQRRAEKELSAPVVEEEEVSVDPPVPPCASGQAGAEQAGTEQAPTTEQTAIDGLRCLTCKVAFGNNRQLHRDHYRSDLHRLNLKMKMKNLPCMTEEEFSLLAPADRDALLHDYR